ncbi:hypothetical protein Tco_0919639 [Tanacetum coccineum]
MMQSYCEIISQPREQEAILLQEQAVEEKQEMLAEEQAANPFEPLPVSYFYNADYDNISTPSTTYTIHLTKSATIITNPSELTLEELFPYEVNKFFYKRIQQILERTSECNVPVRDDFTTVSNPLFDADNDFSSSDDKSFSNEDVPKENFKIFLNPLSDEEIISTKIDPHHFNAESDLIESLLNRDTLIISSPNFDSLLEEFSGELAHINLVSPGINEADFDHEE